MRAFEAEHRFRFDRIVQRNALAPEAGIGQKPEGRYRVLRSTGLPPERDTVGGPANRIVNPGYRAFLLKAPTELRASRTDQIVSG